MKNKDELILKEILQYCYDIENSLKSHENAKEFFYENRMYRHGCCMCIFQIGEYSKRLSDDFKKRESHIPWSDWAGIRNIFAHRYQSANLKLIWDAIELDVPLIKEACERNLNNE